MMNSAQAAIILASLFGMPLARKTERVPMTAADVIRIVDMGSTGLSTAQIARELQLSQITVARVLRKAREAHGNQT